MGTSARFSGSTKPASTPVKSGEGNESYHFDSGPSLAEFHGASYFNCPPPCKLSVFITHPITELSHYGELLKRPSDRQKAFPIIRVLNKALQRILQFAGLKFSDEERPGQNMEVETRVVGGRRHVLQR